VHREQWTAKEGREIGSRYFVQGIACPFLEEESCSIYHDRPMACREYLVTSPATNCARPTRETVDCVPMPMRVWNAVAHLDVTTAPAESHWIPWVPLILAPDWAESHPDDTPARPGPELLRELFEHLTGKRAPVAQPPTVPFDPGPAAPAS
jgi:hypothetical protein